MFMFSIVYDYYLSSLENICLALLLLSLALTCQSRLLFVYDYHRIRCTFHTVVRLYLTHVCLCDKTDMFCHF